MRASGPTDVRTGRRRGDRTGGTFGRTVLGLSVVALLAAGLWPTWRTARRFDALGRIEADVRTVMSAMERYRAERGRWPAPGPRGAVPPELASMVPESLPFETPRYSLEVGLFTLLEEPPMVPDRTPGARPGDSIRSVAPPRRVRLGTLTVHSADSTVRASLLDAFGPERSFATDSVWTIVMPRQGPGG